MVLQFKKDSVIISRKKWEELKKDDYYKELIEILEDSDELEKAKRETTSFTKLKDYIKLREKKESHLHGTAKRISNSKRRINV